MIETLYNFAKIEENNGDKVIEKIVADDNVHINHMLFGNGDALPEHFSNSNVYMIVKAGTLSLQLGDQDFNEYPVGSIVNVPYNIKMNVTNKHDEVLDLFVIKAPNPENYQAK